MERILLDIFICILAGFGAIAIGTCIVKSVWHRVRQGNSNIRLILVVKDQQDTVEGIIRTIFAGDFLGKVMSGRKLLVMDMGSTDDTLNILMKLKKNYEYIDILKEEDKDKVLSCLNESQ